MSRSGLSRVALLPWAVRSTPKWHPSADHGTHQVPAKAVAKSPTTALVWVSQLLGLVSQRVLSPGVTTNVAGVARGSSAPLGCPGLHAEGTPRQRRSACRPRDLGDADRRGVFPICKTASRRRLLSGVVLVTVPWWEPVTITLVLRRW